MCCAAQYCEGRCACVIRSGVNSDYKYLVFHNALLYSSCASLASMYSGI